MFTRILTSAVAGITITAALLYLMHYLIAISHGAVVPRPPITLAPWGTTVVETPVKRREYIRHRIQPPARPPTTRFESRAGEHTFVLRPPVADPVPDGRITFGPVGFNDGPLINLVTVQPHYPASLQAKGLEGFVTVQFDVTTAGTVNNLAVVDSSSRLFHRAAIEAAKKFRFKPRVVDGMAQASHGVLRRFTFELK